MSLQIGMLVDAMYTAGVVMFLSVLKDVDMDRVAIHGGGGGVNDGKRCVRLLRLSRLSPEWSWMRCYLRVKCVLMLR